MSRIVKKIVKIVLIVLAAVIALLLAIKAGERIVYASFYRQADREFTIPGLNDGFVPQGIHYIAEEDAFLVTGYQQDRSDSRVYYLDASRKVTTWAGMKEMDGSTYTGHTGGIALFGEYVYITNDSTLDVFLLSDLTDGDGVMTKIGEITAYIDPAYCSVEGDYLIAGSFHRDAAGATPGSYLTDTPAGDRNSATAVVFKLDEASPFGVDPTPVAVLSTTAQVQGLCLTDDGDVIISTSWGFAHSYLYVYDGDKITCDETPYTVTEGVDVPLYYLDSASLTQTIKAPPMSEEIVWLDGRVYIMNESASNKYIFGKLFSAYGLYSYELN